jgi:hypothetical protein
MFEGNNTGKTAAKKIGTARKKNDRSIRNRRHAPPEIDSRKQGGSHPFTAQPN